ncbi:GH36-type glycosyl hydrolase domain-containing protein [Dehalobacterium formicoaceticum]|uniref:GH36-type glycosyl hydrolase domain-containing protein n=1 Tax=Dehalobacterium formicoaceticum TaxID=51515 RepID=UPI000B7EE08A|nr:glucoamylase family protein [Dehalobacterium formicoaceticum]
MIPLWSIILFLVLILIGFLALSRPFTPRDDQEQPSQDVILSLEDLEKHGAEIAKTHRISKNPGSSDCLLSKMSENFTFITHVYQMLNQDIKDKVPVPAAAEWLLDNFYLIEEQVQEIKLSLVREKCLKLNLLNSGILKGYPRVYGIALEMVSHSDGRIDEEMIKKFINSYQKQSILSMAELWALPLMLKIALIENIKNMCRQMAHTQMQWRKGEQMEPDYLPDLTSFITDYHTLKHDVFSLMEYLMKKRRREGLNATELYEYFEEFLDEFDFSLDEVIQEEHQRLAAQQMAMGNSISSIRLLLALNWKHVFEDLSVVEKLLREDPDGTYGRMDFSSRDYYRQQVEQMARSMKTSETNLVRKALELAQEEEAGSRGRHVGAFLVGAGQSVLKQKIRPGKKEPVQLSPLKEYLSWIFIVSSILVLAVLVYAYDHLSSWQPGLLILVGLTVLIPASDIAIHLVQRIITNRRQPSFLPKLSYDHGIPKEAATFIVMPTLLPDEARVDELVHQLEVHYLANREEHLYFALLGDYKDEGEKDLPGDQVIRQRAWKGIQELNDKYPGETEKFYLFLRERRYEPSEKRWMGWERKRGALVELNRLLTQGDPGSFEKNDALEKLPRVKYVITLDADTRLPLNTAKKLIGTISHPLHQPHFDQEKGLVTEGYGLIQPRISISLESANSTLFTRIFAGQGGIDPYTTGVSDVYQDFFGEGIFTGKGIYNLQVFQQALDGVIPDHTVLSHDLLEGCFLRVGLATDLELIDDYPARCHSFNKRMHRWVRGDWQLLSWLGKRSPLNPLSKWKIIDNLRRSLVAPFLLLLLTLGLTIFPGKGVFWLVSVALTIGFPLVMGLVDYILFKHYKTAWQKCHGNMVFGIKGVIYQTALNWMFLPQQAYLLGDAIVRTLYRVSISRKNMLQWVPAADAEKTTSNDVAGYYRNMIFAPLYGVFLLIIVLLVREENTFYALINGVIWGSAPFAAFYISKPDQKKERTLSSEAREQLRLWAKKTWNFYEDFSGQEDHFLPPDNFQEDPPNGVAHRTSPTNIGFLLLAILSARDFDFITTEQMAEKLKQTLNTIEKLKKWHGHLYNWYDTRTLEVLRPAYISSVDSGNFVGYLMTLKEGLKEYKVETSQEGTKWDEELGHLIRRIEKLINDTRFSPLYEANRQLFSLGYHVEEEKLTDSYYDLLASEARITSFLAIARGEVPAEHWFRLGKSLTMVDGYKGLVSWSGTMFEYFMPTLIMKNYPNTLLDETYRFVLQNQQKYGAKRQVPWGTSESGFYAFDMHLNYQYKAFGVPDLGLKRGLAKDMVVSPYSTFLALPFDAESAWENLKRLRDDLVEGPYGLYEAVDYTRERLHFGKKKGIVKSYMAHHQGMILVALNNYFHQNVMQRRFHGDPVVQAGELLLQEKIPFRVIITKEIKEQIEPFPKEDAAEQSFLPGNKENYAGEAAVHLLSNGHYSLLMEPQGRGYSWQDEVQMTRWRDRGSLTMSGFFIFVRDIQSQRAWSATNRPLSQVPEGYEVFFTPHKGEFIRNDGNITTHTEVTVSPEDDVEIREVTLANHGEESVLLDVTSYLEVVLTAHNTDVAHPVFSNLFIRTEFLSQYDSLIASRRPRESNQPVLWAFHTVGVEGDAIGDVQYETDRSKFIGRGRTIQDPYALDSGHPLSDTVGPVLDPILSLRCRVKIYPGKSVKVAFVLGKGADREQVIMLAEKYHDKSARTRAFELAWNRSQVEAGFLNLKPEEIKNYQKMLAHMVFISPLRKKHQELIGQNTKGQPGLWVYGISGDNPILLLTVKNQEEIRQVETMLKAHEYWRLKGFKVDLVLLNEEEGGYVQPVQEYILEAVQGCQAREVINCPGGVFVLKGSTLSREDRALLFNAGRLILAGNGGPISVQLEEEMPGLPLPKQKHFLKEKTEYPPQDQPLKQLLIYNGYGGFSGGGKEYLIRLKEGMQTPLPWSNVIANPRFGFLVTESGGGFTWAENSRENKLTPWSNDPVSDQPGEIIYLRDEETGEIWTITPQPIREKETYTIRHGIGYSHFHHDSHGLEQELIQFVPTLDPIKINLIRIRNKGKEPRTLTGTYYLKPVLGVSEQNTQQFIKANYHQGQEILLLTNSYHQDFPGRVAFVASSCPVASFTTNEEEFIGGGGSGGTLASPVSLQRESLSGCLISGGYPCAAMQVKIELPPGESKELVFLLGQEKQEEKAMAMGTKYQNLSQAKKALQEARSFWQQKRNILQVETPDPSFNIMVNDWLLYQVLSCRIWGRSAFYQSGGAFGFRDQLQDALSLIYIEPELVKKQILLHAAHQFAEGDVQHWWHPVAGDKGVRTRFSDDLLWLPYVVGEYTFKTGDYEILNIQVPFLEEEPLKEGEAERYGVPAVSRETASLYEHCVRALERGLKFGPHGLPLMGSGDWNDGMSSVGSKGQGESVWLGWFIYSTVEKFLPLCRFMEDEGRGTQYREICREMIENLEEHAWDGSWYRRAYFDDGRPLGSAENSECKIDSLAQSWAVISGAGRKARVIEAMSALENYLIKEEEGIILLLTPPFDEGDLNPGYIKSYVPGVRENGGQYTHAAVWVVMAYARLGMGDQAWELYQMINPINHSRTTIETATYKVEPYVMAADVYAAPPHVGRGGWTWYTGAASWMYQVGIEELLGFKKQKNHLYLDPCIPREWKDYKIMYRYGETLYQILVKNPLGLNQGVRSIYLDGKELKDKCLELIDDQKEHLVEVVLG